MAAWVHRKMKPSWVETYIGDISGSKAENSKFVWTWKRPQKEVALPENEEEEALVEDGLSIVTGEGITSVVDLDS